MLSTIWLEFFGNSGNPPFLVPHDGGIVHLVNKDDEMLDSRSLGKKRMLTCLTTTVEPSLEFSLSRGYNLAGMVS